MIMNLTFNILAFLVAAVGICVCGGRLTAHADEISDRMRIGTARTGFVFLAAATEMPEVVTTVSARLGGHAALALNNMFGGVALQSALLVIADRAAKAAPPHPPLGGRP